MELDIFKDSKFNFLREINNEIIDNSYRETEKVFEFECEDEEIEEDYEDDDFSEDGETYNDYYNALIPNFNSNSVRRIISSDSSNCKYFINFENNELSGRDYYITELTLEKNNCKFKIIPDDLLLNYLHEKINFYGNRYLNKKDICFDLTIKGIVYSGVKLYNYNCILHNAIISTVGSLLSFEEGIEKEVELYFDYMEISK